MDPSMFKFQSPLFASDPVIGYGTLLNADNLRVQSEPFSAPDSEMPSTLPSGMTSPGDEDSSSLPLSMFNMVDYSGTNSMVSSAVNSDAEDGKASGQSRSRRRCQSPNTLVLRKQRRLERNRLSAQLSRQRKKEMFSTIGAEVAVLRDQKARLENLLTTLMMENEQLKMQLNAFIQMQNK
eukprot:EC725248.1.p1 GENE.EC725248.1~~EC725248.1.p1  ORF type:complete len:180 (+),score=27.77 EC725248.1:72-611(+)